VEPQHVEPQPTAQPQFRAMFIGHASGTDRLYGTVHTIDGSTLTGYIRWDRNEGSWTDLMDATKPHDHGGSSVSGIRFGHMSKIDVLSSSSAMVTLKSGNKVRLTANATDLGEGLRALIVETNGHQAQLHWDDLSEVDFAAAPAGEPAEGRLFGTLTTRSGMEFTGFVAWDVDEIYTSDVLDGDDPAGDRQHIPFGAIASIERQSSWSSRVTLADGRQIVLDGTNDVDDSNSGISVSDPALGQVMVDWGEFKSVLFRDADEDAPFSGFDGGAPIRGTVTTTDGRQLTGDVVWDDDETYTWEMLNGEQRDVQFNVEFGQIDSIVKARHGVDVTLRDGRTFQLSNSNDVDEGNRGITVRTGSGAHEIDWEDFAELRLTH
jgi:hypothetical protein